MRILLIALLVALPCFAQSYPTSTATNRTLVVAKDRNTNPVLTSSVNASTLRIPLSDTTGMAVNEVFRMDDEQVQIETIVDSHNVDVYERGYCSTTASTHVSGTPARNIISGCSHNNVRAEIQAIESNVRPVKFVSSLPAVPSPGCTANSIYVLTTTNTMYRCNATGDDLVQISAVTTTEGYVASITIGGTPYAISEATHAQGMWPMTRLFSSGEQVAASIKLTSMSTNGNVSITAAAGTYIVVIRDGGPTSAYHGTVTLISGTGSIAESTHKRGLYPFFQFWNGSGELVTLKQTWASPGTNGNVNLAGADGTYEVSAATGSAMSGGGTGVTDHAALSNLPYGDSGHTGFVGATGLTPTDNDVAIYYSGAWHVVTLPSCSNATTSKLLYNNSTHAFSCGTDQNSGGTTYTPDGTGLVTITGSLIGLNTAVVPRVDTAQTITSTWDFSAGLLVHSYRTKANLPACTTTRWTVYMIDATSSSDCTTGGSTGHLSICHCDGSSVIHSLGTGY